MTRGIGTRDEELSLPAHRRTHKFLIQFLKKGISHPRLPSGMVHCEVSASFSTVDS